MKNQKSVILIVLFLIIIIFILVALLIRNMLLSKADKLNAEYEARFHTVYFDTDGGKTISPKKVESFAGISNVSAEKDGYIFQGWLLDGKLIDYSFTPLTQDITLKASYRKKENTDTNNYQNNNNNNDNNSINKPSTTYSNNSNTQMLPENKQTYNVNIRKIGLGFENGKEVEKCALTVLNYQTETYNSEVGEVKDGQEWVIVNMKFENESDSTVVIDKNDFEIIDGAGKYGYAPYYKHLNNELGTVEIRAGQTATFSVRFVYYKDHEMILHFNNPSIVTYAYTEIKLR